MRRFAALVLATALVVGVLLRAGEAQQPPKIARIGYLSPLSVAADSVYGEAFRQGLRALGYIEGQNVLIEARYADGKPDRLPDLAAELVRLQVDVIVAAPTSAVRAVQQATQTIPIVMAFSGDPVGERLAAGLPRPGGNVTGQSTAVAEVAAKRLEFLKTIVPRLSHVSHLLMTEQTRRAVTETEAAGQTLGVQVTAMAIHNASELDRALASMLKAHVGGVIVSLALRPHFQAIAQFALKNRLPAISGPRDFVEAGGLMAYGPHYPDLFRRSATYVDKILRGARPAELPIEQPTTFEFAINRKTARALGLAIPPSLLLQADHVVD